MSGLFPSGLSKEILSASHISPVYDTCPAHPMLLVLNTKIIKSRPTNYEALLYVIISILLLFPASQVQIFFTALCSQTPLIYVRDQVSHPNKMTNKAIAFNCRLYIGFQNHRNFSS
jgi:hypothetical protein